MTFNLDPNAQVGAIDPLSYGANHFDVAGVKLRRFGGNRVTGYNWEGNQSNAGSDYLQSSDYYLLGQVGLPQNAAQAPAAVPVGYATQFRALGTQAEIISVQAAGFVSADAAGSVTAGQTAPSARWKQVLPHKPGWPASLSLSPNKADGFVYIDEQVNYLVDHFGPASTGGIRFYAIDNEPGIWNSTHPYLHPAAPTYAEVLAKVSATAAAVLDIDPSANILAPACYGWGEYIDLSGASDASANNPTYTWFLGYFLDGMHTASLAAGHRLLHFLDIHWYPEAQDSTNTRIIAQNPDKTDMDASNARMQAPRSLWDPTYDENSWLHWSLPPADQNVRLIPRLQASIAAWYPGTRISFSEYDYGATDHISGGIAQADVLGIVGKYGIPACRWGAVSLTSCVQSAFNLYLNYDGAGTAFGDLSFSAVNSDTVNSSVYAAKSSTDASRLTVMVLNKYWSTSLTMTVNLTLPGGQSINSISAWGFDSTSSTVSVQPAPLWGASSFSQTLPQLCVRLYEVRLNGATTPTSTVTPSASPCATETALGSFTETPTSSASPTLTITPSITGSPTATVAVTATPIASGPNHIDKAVPLPNPDPVAFQLFLQGPADAIQLDLYSTALTLEKQVKITRTLSKGWNSVALPSDFGQGLGHGLHYFSVKARQGTDLSKAVMGKLYLLN